MHPQEIPLDQLLLDPNNYRLQEQDGFTQYPEHRFHVDRVQDTTRRMLQSENLTPLRNSIVSNGFLQIERIVVVPYEHANDKVLVIEGNRRIAALLLIRDQYEAGIELPPTIVEVFQSVPCLVADDEEQDAFFREAIMGIRHVGGIKEWGGYQRAKLVADLRDSHDLDAISISNRIGLSVIEVNRRYRAFKALQQMENDEDYADYAKPQLYPLFHEAVSLPTVRQWLGWDGEACTFDDEDTRELFYQMISPRTLDERDTKSPKLNSYSDVRALRRILPIPDAKAELLQMDKDLVDALAIANRDQMSRRWKSELNDAMIALRNIPALEVRQFDTDDVAAITTLVETANEILEIYRNSNP